MSNLTQFTEGGAIKASELNSNFNALGVDYIVEQGTSGSWYYRKWNSGIAECWGTRRTSQSTANTTSNPKYNDVISLPFTFADTSYKVYITLEYNGSVISNFYGDCNSGANKEHTTTTFTIGYSLTSNYSVGMNFYVYGTWK